MPSRLMRALLFSFIAIGWATDAQALDSTVQSLVASSYVTSEVTTAPFDSKIILAARHDAAAFVASNGQLRGAQLETALMYLRQSQTKLRASDLELAQAILVK